MGVVWRAQDSLLRRNVAIKEIEIPHAVASDERDSIRKRVQREARAAARLNHANAVTVFDVIEDDGKAFIVMELIAGRTLEDIVKQDGPVDPARVCDIALAVLGALEMAHGEGIVHRDVKPANVMIRPDGRVKLADFGIASVKDDPKITASGLILGSPSYMAPEQANHGTSGPEADLWGLGTTMYFAVEGATPFERDGGAIPILTAVVGDDPRPMESAGRLAPVIEALLEKDPQRRPNVARVREMLHEIGSPESRATTTPKASATAQESTADDRGKTSDRGKWIALAVALALLAAAALFVIPQLGSDDDRAGERRGGAGAPAEDGADVSVPAAWTTYEDPDIGYSVRYPAEWGEPSVRSNGTFFTDPDTGTYLQVAYSQPPTAETPQAAWEAYAPTFGARKEAYTEIGITPTTYKGMDAATWEYTYVEDGSELHAVDLGFIVPYGDEGTGMALLFQAHAEDWAPSQELFEQLKAGFEPPS